MKNQNQELVYLDGMWLRKEQLLQLAMNAGHFALAEHYLCALLADAVAKGRREAMAEVNQVREHYGLKAIPLTKDDMEDDEDLTGRTRQSMAEEQTKRLFIKMSRENRVDVLRRCVSLLVTNYHLFIYARHWLGIFMVVRDRLFGGCMSQTEFLLLASEITPDDMPVKLRMCKSTMKNFGREIGEADRRKAYYKMQRNPQKELCETFWNIIQEMILTGK